MPDSKRITLGPLLERPFRRLFAATTISTFGDAIEHIALAFAVLALPGAGAGDLGLVLAARTVVNTLVVVAGGVVSDRIPRNVVLVGASLLQDPRRPSRPRSSSQAMPPCGRSLCSLPSTGQGMGS